MNTNQIPPLALMIGLLCLLSGCGQKGPLYLPDEPQKQLQQK